LLCSLPTKVNAASDKMAIAKYLSALEEERKNTLGVMTVRGVASVDVLMPSVHSTLRTASVH
jgi:hypothetical protein